MDHVISRRYMYMYVHCIEVITGHYCLVYEIYQASDSISLNSAVVDHIKNNHHERQRV